MVRTLAWILPVLLLGTGCVEMIESAHAPRTDFESVEAGAAEMVRAEIDMPVGELRISGGAAKLMEGEFTYTAPELRPQVAYEETGFRGRLTVALASEKRVMPVKGEDNRWTVRLADGVPMDLHVKLGIGKSEVHPAGMSLRSLDVELGVGEAEIDLTGATWERNFDVRIHGGIGEAGIRVPNDVGVVATATGGIGEIHVVGMRRDGDRWVNDAYGESPVTITVEAKGGIGEIRITSEE
jgi:hypothetical protein